MRSLKATLGKATLNRIEKLSKLLSAAGANVVLSGDGIRRGNILVAKGKNPLITEINKIHCGGRELLIHARDKSAKDFREAISDTLNERASFLDSLRARKIEAFYGFKSVLLIAPYRSKSDNVIAHPKGVYRLAYWLLRKTVDVDAVIFNPNLAPLDELFLLSQRRNFDVVGHSVLNPTLRCDAEIILRLAENSPNSLRLIGGVAASNVRPKDIFDSLPVDVIVRGAGEKPLTAIMGRLTLPPRKNLSGYLGVPGVVVSGYPETYGNIPQLLSRDEFFFSALADVVNVPYSRRTHDIFHGGRSYWEQTQRVRGEKEDLIPFNEIGSRAIRIVTSDYCKGKCIFCSVRSYEKRLTSNGYVKIQMTPEEMVALVELAEKLHQFDSIHWDDDDFLNDPERITKFCELIIKKKLNKYPMLVKARADEIGRRLLKLMKEAGIKIIGCGVEDLSDNLKRLGKGITPEKVEETLSAIIEEGIICGVNEIAFSHISTPETIEENIKRTVAILKRGNAYFGAAPRMEAYFGAPIMRYKGGKFIQYEELMLPGMKKPLRLPTVVMFEDPRTEILFEKAIAERDKFLPELLRNPRYKLKHILFPVLSLALFRGIYVALNKTSEEIAEIEELIFNYVESSMRRSSK